MTAFSKMNSECSQKPDLSFITFFGFHVVPDIRYFIYTTLIFSTE